MSNNPLAEVFGFPIDNMSEEAKRYRKGKLCPFNNRVPNCTKDKALDPLGVCSIFDEAGDPTVTCPIRFRQNWTIAEDAAAFFFAPNSLWTSLTEVRLKDRNGLSAGNIDVVLVSYDEWGKILDFGSLEVQAVYISGNIRNPFASYMKDPDGYSKKGWDGPNYPRADYLSSSRKRLAPQIFYKGGIFRQWNKKQAVALHKSFYATLPALPEVKPEKADIAWFLYDLKLSKGENRFTLSEHQTIYTAYEPALELITKAPAGPIEEFMEHLQLKLHGRLSAPDAPTLQDIFNENEE